MFLLLLNPASGGPRSGDLGKNAEWFAMMIFAYILNSIM